MKDDIIVSVCCITYNQAKYIREALEGFLMQETIFPIEIIIHDDCSTDGTTEIVRDYEERNPYLITTIFQAENQKSQGRKIFPLTFERARGKYIAMCEGDDYWTDPLKLQKQVDFLEANPEYVLTGGYAQKIYENENYEMFHDTPKYEHSFDFDDHFLMTANPIATLTACFRNGIVRQYPEIYFQATGGDRTLYLMLCQHGKGRYMHEPLGVYRIHKDGSESRQGKFNMLEETIAIAIEWNKYYNGKYDKEVEWVLHTRGKGLIRELLASGNWVRAASYSHLLKMKYIRKFRSQLITLVLKYLLGSFVKKNRISGFPQDAL